MTIDPACDSTFAWSGEHGATRHHEAITGAGLIPHGIAGPPGMLAGNADRERAIDVLKAGFAESRLTKAEYDDRMARVHAARTYGELRGLVSDLPAGPLGGAVHYPGPGYPPQVRAHSATSPLAVAALACGIGEFFTMGLTAIPAIVLGHVARRQVHRTGQRGDGMAVAGLTLGWAGIGLIVAIIAGLIIATRASGHSISVVPGGPVRAASNGT